MSKKIDLNQSVYDITKTYPEVIDIMVNLGFDEIKKPAMLNSVGRIMTIPKGAKAKGISIPVIIAELIKNGFEITGNTELLKDYLKRLGNGEDLESVKKDFVKNFSDVDASEIMKAEQELIKEGTPITEVQKLCDVHSALFHGLTKEEKIANAEKAVEESLKKEEASEMKTMPDAYVRKHELAKALRETKGHPLYSFTEENERFSKEIADIRGALEKGEDVSKKISDFRQIATHYAKKGDLIYPLLKVRYEISGPSDVMWSVDDEIRDELAAIDKECNHDKEWIKRVQAVLTRADEMMSLLANTLADAAGHAGCLPILDCFSPHPGEEVTVSIPMCDDTVDIVLEDLDFPHEWEELLENSGADTMGDLVDYLCYCSQNNISLAISPEDEEKLYATLIDVCYENMSYDRQVDFWRHVLETNSLVCEVKE